MRTCLFAGLSSGEAPDIANTLRVFGDGPVRDLARLRTLGFGQELDFEGCRWGADLAWRGRWLLYSKSEKRAAVIDSSLRAP